MSKGASQLLQPHQESRLLADNPSGWHILLSDHKFESWVREKEISERDFGFEQHFFDRNKPKADSPTMKTHFQDCNRFSRMAMSL